MELDETDPAVWLKLEAATEEYIRNNSQAFNNVCERLLLPYQREEKWSELKTQPFPKGKASAGGTTRDFLFSYMLCVLTFRKLIILCLHMSWFSNLDIIVYLR